MDKSLTYRTTQAQSSPTLSCTVFVNGKTCGVDWWSHFTLLSVINCAPTQPSPTLSWVVHSTPLREIIGKLLPSCYQFITNLSPSYFQFIPKLFLRYCKIDGQKIAIYCQNMGAIDKLLPSYCKLLQIIAK